MIHGQMILLDLNGIKFISSLFFLKKSKNKKRKLLIKNNDLNNLIYSNYFKLWLNNYLLKKYDFN